MAKADLEMKVCLEKAIHTALQKLLQQIWDDHQVCVREISIDWTDVSSAGEPKMLLMQLHVQSSTKAHS